MEGWRPHTYGDAYADVYDRWYGESADVGAVVDALAAEATGPILELGVGTGRLALPLAARGHEVVGVDASAAMLDVLASKASDPGIEVHRTDMARLDDVPRAERFGLGFAAFNTLLNLASSAERCRCLGGVSRLLASGGLLAIEAVVPGPDPATPEDHVEIRSLEIDRLVLTVSRRDPIERTVSGHHVELTDGAPVRLRPWMIGYATPGELDDEAARSGLELVRRVADWRGTPFTPESTSHVTWYRKA